MLAAYIARSGAHLYSKGLTALLLHTHPVVRPAAKPPSNPKIKARAPVPTRDEKPVMGLQSNKNFITANAVEVILAKPKKVPQEEFVWTSRPGFAQVSSRRRLHCCAC